MFDQLEMLDPSRTNWKVKVRITRMWASVLPDKSNAISGYNAILLDDDVSIFLIVFHFQYIYLI